MTPYDPSAAVAEFELTEQFQIAMARYTDAYPPELAEEMYDGFLDLLRAALDAAYRAGEAGKGAEYERGKRDAYLNVLADATGGLMDAVMARAPWDVEEEIRDKARRHGVTGEEFDL
jgi:hypothetical protein